MFEREHHDRREAFDHPRRMRPQHRVGILGLRASGKEVNTWSLVSEVMRVQGMFIDQSLATMVQKAARFIGIVQKIEFEKTSQRFLITYVAINGDGKPETIRSQRIDGRHGTIAQTLWSQDLIGHKVIMFRLNENVGKEKMREKGYRTAVWVTDRGEAKQSQQQ